MIDAQLRRQVRYGDEAEGPKNSQWGSKKKNLSGRSVRYGDGAEAKILKDSVSYF